MKKSLLSSLFLGFSILATAQQDPQYTQFMFNRQLYNPAVTGFDNNHCMALLARTQYAKYLDESYTLNNDASSNTEIYGGNGAKTVTFSYGAPIPFARDAKGKNSGGVGMSVYSDKAAYINTTYLKLDIAGKRALPFNRTIGVGVNIGAMQKAIDFGGFLFKDPGDPLIGANKTSSNMNVNFGAGVWFNDPDRRNLTLGYAIQNLSKKEFSFGLIDAVRPGLHQYINASMDFDVIAPGMVLTPSLMVKASQDSKGVFTNPDFSLAGILKYNQKLSVGLGIRSSTRTFESFSAIIGWNLNQALRIGYSFDFNTTKLRFNNSNTHELVLNYCFRLTLPERVEIILVDPVFLDKDPNIE